MEPHLGASTGQCSSSKKSRVYFSTLPNRANAPIDSEKQTFARTCMHVNKADLDLYQALKMFQKFPWLQEEANDRENRLMFSDPRFLFFFFRIQKTLRCPSGAFPRARIQFASKITDHLFFFSEQSNFPFFFSLSYSAADIKEFHMTRWPWKQVQLDDHLALIPLDLKEWGLCALRHSIQISMEAILACHPARSTEWLDCHSKSCELWRIRTGPIA